MKSDPVQGILFREQAVRPANPVVRLRRNIKNLPERIRHLHKPARHINVEAPISRDITDDIWNRLRTK